MFQSSLLDEYEKTEDERTYRKVKKVLSEIEAETINVGIFKEDTYKVILSFEKISHFI